MSLKEKWDAIINLHCDVPLDNWNFAFKKYGNLYDLMINKQSGYLFDYIDPLLQLCCSSRLTHVYLYNITDSCENDLFESFKEHGFITLTDIKRILVKNYHSPLYGQHIEGHTRYEISSGRCIWYIYCLN